MANPIYKYALEEFFPAQPALDVAKAIRRDDVAAINQLFAQHPDLDPNLKGQQGLTFLLWAFSHHHVNSMKALVAHGADVNRPLHLPNEKGGVDVTHLVNVAARGPKDELLVETIQWQIKVKHLLIAKGVKFPVLSSGAARYHDIRTRWEQTPEGHAWRVKLDALGAQPDVVGKPWTKEELAARTAMRAWMQREGIPQPAFFTPTPKGNT